MPPIEQLEQTQYLVKVLISRLGQLVLVSKGIYVQQTIVAFLLVNFHVATGLPIYGNGMPPQQPRKLTHIHNHVKICLEIHLMEDHLIETHLEDRHLIHMLNFTNGQHLIQECSYHHGIHQLQFDLNQPINYHTKNFSIQHM